MAKVVGEEIVAGRLSILLEWTGEVRGRTGRDRIWVDAINGQVLRYEVYGGLDGRSPQALYLVTQVYLDEELPDWLFYPGAYQGENLQSLLYWDGVDELVSSLRRGPQSGN
jgi:hypothetical protein